MSIFDLHKDGVAPSVIDEAVVPKDQWQQQFGTAIEADNLHEAYRLYKRLPDHYKHDYLKADDVFKLAHYAQTERQSEDALAIVEGFSKRYPEHPDVVKNYLIAANVMYSQFGEREQAQVLLAQLESYYASHADAELIAQAKASLK